MRLTVRVAMPHPTTKPTTPIRPMIPYVMPSKIASLIPQLCHRVSGKAKFGGRP